MNAPIQLDVHPFTDRGRREYQEDFFYTDPPPRAGLPWLGAVADGMGGHVGGDVASQAGIHGLKQGFEAAIAASRSTADALVEGATRGHEAVLAAAEKVRAEGNMGSTLSAFAIDGSTLHWCSTGDSRIYLQRDGRLLQITRDFTLAEDMRQAADQGDWTEAEIEDSPQRNALTSFMGTDRWRYHNGQMALQHGDLVVACSDGVWGTIGSDGLLGACSQGGGSASAQQIAADLLRRVLEVAKPNQDNSTAVVVRYLAAEVPALVRAPTAPPDPQPRRGLGWMGGGLVALAGLGVVGWLLSHSLGPPTVAVAGSPVPATAPGGAPLPAGGALAVPSGPAGSAAASAPPSPTQAPTAPSPSPVGQTPAQAFAFDLQQFENDVRAGRYQPLEVPGGVRMLRNRLAADDLKETPPIKSRLDKLLQDAQKKTPPAPAPRPARPPRPPAAQPKQTPKPVSPIPAPSPSNTPSPPKPSPGPDTVQPPGMAPGAASTPPPPAATPAPAPAGAPAPATSPSPSPAAVPTPAPYPPDPTIVAPPSPLATPNP